MNCKQCGSDFNDTSRRPKLLPKCGDSLCLECLDRLRSTGEDFRCPADGILYSKNTEIFDNAFVLNCLAASKPNSTFCNKHNKDLELYCADCNVEICPSCVLFGEHKSHKYEQLSEFRARFSSQLNEFQRKLENIERNLSAKMAEGMSLINRARAERQSQIDSKFDELGMAVNRARNAAKEEVALVYENLIESADKIKIRIKELNSRIGECLRGKNSTREDSISREIKEISIATENNELFKGKESIIAKSELIFSRSTYDAINKFATLAKLGGVHSTPKSLTKHKPEIADEDNLLQESFKELMKGSSDSPNEEFERNERTPVHRPIQPTKSLSPVSSFSGITSIRSLNAKKEDIKPLLNQTLAETRKLSLSPANASMIARSSMIKSGAVVSPLKTTMMRQMNEKENVEVSTNLKLLSSKSLVSDKISSQIELVNYGRSSLLDLSSAGIDDKALENLSKKIGELKTCKTIKLNNNMITELGVKSLLKAIKDLSVEYLFLNNNSLKDTALDYIISFKKYNSSMKCVYMNHNSISKSTSKTKIKLKLLEEGNISVVL